MSGRHGVLVKNIITTVVAVLIIAAIAGCYVFRQEIEDRISAATFDTPPRLTEIISHLQLTEQGELIFAASHPTIDGSQRFNEQCADVSHAEQGHVLGCFSNGRIHLYDVTDDRLSGIVEVTAAHELLHVMWSRMSTDKRHELGERLTAVYESLVPTHPELEERMSVYRHLPDASFENELHSVLATEVSVLPEWLEHHYAKWLGNRHAIVGHFTNYYSIFDTLIAEADQLEARMAELRESIEARSDAYETAVSNYNADAKASQERFARIKKKTKKVRSAYASERHELRERSTELQRSLDSIQADIDRYNTMRDDLTELSELSRELNEKLDSTLAPLPTRPKTEPQ